MDDLEFDEGGGWVDHDIHARRVYLHASSLYGADAAALTAEQARKLATDLLERANEVAEGC